MHVHSFIEPDDEIYFFYEYTPRMGFDFSPGNNLISNLKKDVVRFADNPQVLGYKRRAILQCADMITQGFNPEWLKDAVIVPVPPSKAKEDPAHDDRMFRVAKAVRINSGLKPPAVVREIVRQTASLQKSHESGDGERPSIQALLEAYEIDEASCQPAPDQIVILDDMLTTGRHHRAMYRLLNARFPAAEIIGVFITRRVVPEGPDFDGVVIDL